MCTVVSYLKDALLSSPLSPLSGANRVACRRLLSGVNLLLREPRLVTLANCSQVHFNLFLRELAESLARGHDADFNLVGTEVGREHRLETRDGRVQRRLVVHCGVRLDLLLQVVLRFLLLGAGRRSLVPPVVTRRVNLEELRALFFIDTNEERNDAERAHRRVLRVDLRDVGDALGQHMRRHLVAKLVLEFVGLVTETLRLCTRIRCRGNGYYETNCTLVP
jgi:hypothetical protein